MPWTATDAQRHTHKATTPELQELWAKVANEALQRLGDEGQAIREANAVVARQGDRALRKRGTRAAPDAQLRRRCSISPLPAWGEGDFFIEPI